jgi:hypothetical protein
MPNLVYVQYNHTRTHSSSLRESSAGAPIITFTATRMIMNNQMRKRTSRPLSNIEYVIHARRESTAPGTPSSTNGMIRGASFITDTTIAVKKPVRVTNHPTRKTTKAMSGSGSSPMYLSVLANCVGRRFSCMSDEVRRTHRKDDVAKINEDQY